MDEKTILPTTAPTATNQTISATPSEPNNKNQNGRDRHALRRILVALCFMMLVWTLCGLDMEMDLEDDDDDALSVWSLDPLSLATINTITVPQTVEHEPVALEAHIMSKCPDARDCLRELVLPAMQRVYTKVNFTLSFIGTPTDSDDGVACKHGAEECLGNIIELCAQKLYPDPKSFLGFTMCLTKNYEEIPQRSLIEDCALEHAIDFDKLNECATKDDGAYGISLLRESVKRSSAAGVTKSCTVRLDNKIFCIRDGGRWSDCPHGSSVNDLVLAVEKLYGREQ
ncbi:hypothetical protein B0T20DRAFT_202858 [Sordaria brevicollis]|uniref:Uncharacterized protein n=1 Tax=Sordaria brevicollis TaxID=83679 RepID=A0AAE0UBN7_SORBR|nr:hypothetical protein B0T20DRAFT_202858 [Sordaria brevicollis]